MESQAAHLSSAQEQQTDSSTSHISSIPSSMHATSATSLVIATPFASDGAASIPSSLHLSGCNADPGGSNAASPLLQHCAHLSAISSTSVNASESRSSRPAVAPTDSPPDSNPQPTLWQRMKNRREKKNAIHQLGDHSRENDGDAPDRLEKSHGPQSAWWKKIYRGQDQSELPTRSNLEIGVEESVVIDNTRMRELEETSSLLKHPYLNEIGALNELASETCPAIPIDVPATPVDGICERRQNAIEPARDARTASSTARDKSSSSLPPKSPAAALQAPAPVIPHLNVPAPHDKTENGQPSFPYPTPGPPEQLGILCKTDADLFLIGRVIDPTSGLPRPQRPQDEHLDPDIFYSRASSVAATFNDDTEAVNTQAIALKAAPKQDTVEPVTTQVAEEIESQYKRASVNQLVTLSLSPIQGIDTDEVVQPVSATQPEMISIVPELHQNRDAYYTIEALGDGFSREEGADDISRVREIVALRLNPGAAPRGTVLSAEALGRIPSQLSDLVILYRTNEWAKHISIAENPTFDEPCELSQGQEGESSAQVVEEPAALVMQSLKRITSGALYTPTTPTREGHDYTTSTLAPESTDRIPYNLTKAVSNSVLQDPVYGYIQDIAGRRRSTLQHVDSGGLLPISASANSLPFTPRTRGVRSISSPLTYQNLRSARIDENAEAQFVTSPRPPASLVSGTAPETAYQSPNYTRQLGASSIHSLRIGDEGDAGSSQYASSAANPSGGSNYHFTLDREDDDNVSLSELKARIHSRRRRASSIHSDQSQSSSLCRIEPPAVSSSPFEHPEFRLSSWRDTVQHEAIVSGFSQNHVHQRRADMLWDKQQARLVQQQQELARVYMENAFDQAMRRRDMQMLHREAMRKMQAQANRHLRKISA